jgi:hypothetical protein
MTEPTTRILLTGGTLGDGTNASRVAHVRWTSSGGSTSGALSSAGAGVASLAGSSLAASQVSAIGAGVATFTRSCSRIGSPARLALMILAWRLFGTSAG